MGAATEGFEAFQRRRAKEREREDADKVSRAQRRDRRRLADDRRERTRLEAVAAIRRNAGAMISPDLAGSIAGAFGVSLRAQNIELLPGAPVPCALVARAVLAEVANERPETPEGVTVKGLPRAVCLAVAARLEALT